MLVFDQSLLQAKEYWTERLGLDPCEPALRLDYPRPVEFAGRHGSLEIIIDGDVYQKLLKVTKNGSFLLYVTLMAALKVCVHRYTGQSSVTIGSPLPQEEIESGTAPNALAIVDHVDDSTSFKQLLLNVRQTLLDAYAHANYPFERLLRDVRASHVRNRCALFDIALVLEEMHGELPEVKNDVTITFVRGPQSLQGLVTFNEAVLKEETVARFVSHFINILGTALDNTGAPVQDLEILSEAERQLIIHDWNRTSTAPRSETSLQQCFEAQVERTPDEMAVICGAEQFSYQQLNRRANQLAHALRARGVGPEVLVGICVERSAELIAGIFGILKAGGAYVPIDAAYPRDRIAYMVADAGIQIMLTQRRLAESLREVAAELIYLDDDAAFEAEKSENPSVAISSDNAAYVIYTSGSTGRPKGVIVTHRSLLSRVDFFLRVYPLGPGSRHLQFVAHGFDVLGDELYPTLCSGGAMVVLPDLADLSAADVMEKCGELGVTKLTMAASYWHQIVDEWSLTGKPVPRSLNFLLTGGEPAAAERLHEWAAMMDHPSTFMNAYGPTEATIVATVFGVSADPESVKDIRKIPIGRPIENTRIYLLDQRLRPVPVGVAGEIYIGGIGVARGYLNRSALTAEKFIPDPFSDEPGARLYRTGDMACYRPDGVIDFVGRDDQQVKVRGFRIELGEIETALMNHELVREAVVLVLKTAHGDARIVAYVMTETGQEVASDELREFLSGKLPEYMVPSIFQTLAAMPLSPNGKVDRRALSLLTPDAGKPRTEYIAPATPVQKTLAEIWCRVLGVERVGINDNFFELGGHSLLATQTVSRIRDAFRIEMPLLRLFETPTVAGLASSIETLLSAELKEETVLIKPVSRESELPLSFAQQRLWFLDQLDPGNCLYNVPLAVRLSGELDVRALERTLSEVVRRHEVLRTSFPAVGGEPRQVIAPATEFVLPFTDLSELDEANREREAGRLAAVAARRGFDLAHGPLLRAELLKLAAQEHVVLLTMHHIVSDGWSLGVLLEEVAQLYASYKEEREVSGLRELPVQYADYAAWQRSWLAGEVLEAELSYWREQLADLPPRLELPADYARPQVQSFRGAELQFRLNADVVQQLRAVCREQQVTLFMALLGPFAALLSRYTGAERVVVGTPIAGRTRAETEPLIGFFVNTLALSLRVSGAQSWAELWRQVREVSLGAQAHQEVPFERLVSELQPERSLSQQPLVQVMFALQNATGGVAEGVELAGLQLSPFSWQEESAVGAQTAKFDLSLSLAEVGDEVVGSLTYATDLFAAETIGRLAQHYQRLVTAACAEPAQAVGRVRLLSEAEQEQLAARRQQRDYSRELSLVEQFAHEARRRPEAVALECDGAELSYGELLARVESLAARLQELGVGPGTVVGLLLERSFAAVASVLAVWQTGAAYLPLEPSYPVERLRYMVQDAGVELLLVNSGVQAEWHEGSVLSLNDALTENRRPVAVAHEPQALAYLLYTSGTTGRPKAVAVEQRQLRNLLCASREEFGWRASDVMPVLSPLSFDISLFELLTPLLAGGRALLLQRTEVLESGALVKQLAAATVVHMVPSLLRQVAAELEAGGVQLGGVRRLLVGGELVPPELLRHAQRVFPRAAVTVLYGPTEATIVCTHKDYEAGAVRGGEWRALLGQSFTNVRLHIVNESGVEQPLGVAGEIAIGGAGVTRGYLGQAGLTASRYVPDSLSGARGGRLYLTGDVGRWTSAGELEFLGRVDEQVKVRGFRVEPAEVAAVLEEQAQVRAAVVLARPELQGSGQRLIAYVVGEEKLTTTVLREHLLARLPEYMVPAVFVMLDELPLNANGKLDKRALPDPDRFVDRERELIAPRTALELQLVNIWEDVLERRPIGVTENFFALGGHSLLAVRLMARIEQEFGQQIPLANLFQYGTVEQFGKLIEQQGGEQQWSPIVAIQPHGDRRPFFCVHPAGGQVLCYYQLSRLLGPDQPFYAWQAPEFTDIAGGEDDYSTIEARATAYIAAMKQVQPVGPYLLGGYSFGATVAFEIAQQLQRAGERVSLLAQLDAIAPVISLDLDESLMLLGAAREMAGWAGRSLPVTADELSGMNREEQLDYVFERMVESGIVPPDVDTSVAFPWVRRMLKGFSVRNRAFQLYRPQPYGGEVTLFRAEVNPMYLNDTSESLRPIVEIYTDPTHGWGGLSDRPVNVIPVQGYHETLLMEPNVTVLAEHLKAAIVRTEEN